MEMKFIPKEEFEKVAAAKLNWKEQLELIAKMARLNTLFEVKRAGSGHLGSSLSAMDIVIYMYYRHLNVKEKGPKHPDRDIYFSSKGHDAPGQYAVLYSLGLIPEEKFLALRRLGGLDGHPDTKIPGIEANTGSLGMGISKARGMATAKQMRGWEGRVFVMTGDGEFQEGENFEALQSTVSQKQHNVTVVMDHNKLQSDRYIDRINSLGDLDKKIASFGWEVVRIDGHDYDQLEKAFTTLRKFDDKPKFVIADTIKGRGISFMEHPTALPANNGFYKWHSGAPDDASYTRAYDELWEGVQSEWKRLGLGTPSRKEPAVEARPVAKMSGEFLCDAYGDALMELAEKDKDFVVLDADLSLDCRLRKFEDKYPKRFFEMGIAEQDMVSMGSGLALQGFVPIMHSFANFLAARANEQIYNALTERNKMIFSCHYAGLIPAGPGKSHQAIRDISLFSAFPDMTIVQGSSGEELRQLTHWAVLESKHSVMMRVNIGPSPRLIPLPSGYRVSPGRGVALTPGEDTVLFAYGPVMLNEALLAQEILKDQKKLSVKVVNMPWLNRFDLDWLKSELAGCKHLYVVDDHSPTGGLGDLLLAFLNEKDLLKNIRFQKFGVEGFPACGTPWEALSAHKLDGRTLAGRIAETR